MNFPNVWLEVNFSTRPFELLHPFFFLFLHVSIVCAVYQGADYVEFDVQLTHDEKVVVFHDFSFNAQQACVSKKKKRGFQSCLIQNAWFWYR